MKNVRIATGAAIIAILTTTCANARPVATAKETNLRKEASTESEVLTLVPKGAKVEVGTCEKEWCKVSYNGQDGYMIAQNLGLAAGPRPPGPPRVAAGPYPADYPAGPPPAYGPPAYYGPYYYPYGPYYRPYYYGWGGYGWGRRWW